MRRIMCIFAALNWLVMVKYIYLHKNWTDFYWQDLSINGVFGRVRNLQGLVAGQMRALGFDAKSEAALNTLTMDVLKSSEIEGERLDYNQVRSSIAERLGINTAGIIPRNRNVDGIVELMLDATQNYKKPLSHKRLFAWHASLFHKAYSDIHKIEVGCYRSRTMQIVSGAIGREKIHYEAIPAVRVKKEMDHFIKWFNADNNLDSVIKAAIAHFWFIIIHPFDDGNGRIARALTDLLLARSDESSERYYSMSNQMMSERDKYYEALYRNQTSDGDITDWLVWFLLCLEKALLSTEITLAKIMRKTLFWDQNKDVNLNERQRFMLNKLLDGFDGKLKSSKWAAMTKCSTDTALRDIKDLIDKNILQQENQGGRSTNYELKDF